MKKFVMPATRVFISGWNEKLLGFSLDRNSVTAKDLAQNLMDVNSPVAEKISTKKTFIKSLTENPFKAQGELLGALV